MASNIDTIDLTADDFGFTNRMPMSKKPSAPVHIPDDDSDIEAVHSDDDSLFVRQRPKAIEPRKKESTRPSGFRLPSMTIRSSPDRSTSRTLTLAGSPTSACGPRTPPSISERKKKRDSRTDPAALATPTKKRRRFGDHEVNWPLERRSTDADSLEEDDDLYADVLQDPSRSRKRGGASQVQEKADGTSAQQHQHNAQVHDRSGASIQATSSRRQPNARQQGHKASSTQFPTHAQIGTTTVSDIADSQQQILDLVRTRATKVNAQEAKLEAQHAEIDKLYAHMNNSMGTFAKSTRAEFQEVKEKYQELIYAADEEMDRRARRGPPPPGAAYGGPRYVQTEKPVSVPTHVVAGRSGRSGGGQ